MKIALVILSSVLSFAALPSFAGTATISSDGHFFSCHKNDGKQWGRLFTVGISPAGKSGRRSANLGVSSGFRIPGTPIDWSKFKQTEELSVCVDTSNSIRCLIGQKVVVEMPRLMEIREPGYPNGRYVARNSAIDSDGAFCVAYENKDWERYVYDRANAYTGGE